MDAASHLRHDYDVTAHFGYNPHCSLNRVKTGPMDLKFGMETKFDLENTKMKGKLEIDIYLINYA